MRWTNAKLESARLRRLFAIPRWIEPLGGAIGIAIFAALVYFGFAGNQDPGRNVVPTFVYVFFWTMIPLLSAVLGDVFRPFNPWRAVGLGSSWLRARVAPGRKLLSSLMLVYLAFQLVGMAMFGPRRWLERGDAFGVYFEFFSRIAPLTVVKRALHARVPLSGLTDITSIAGTVVFICTMIGITVFDGLERGGIWQSIAGKDPSTLVMTLGLSASVGIVVGFYRLGVLGMGGSHIEKSPRELSFLFAPSLVPIALGYLIAHYFSFIIFVGQALPHVIAHPMGNSGAPPVDYFLSGKAIWWVQVSALLIGHIMGLIVAHDKAQAVWGRARAASQSQTWMLVVMVGFTTLGLWLLSQSNQ